MWNIWQTDHSTHSASLTRNRLQVELGAGFIVTVDVQERCGFVTRVLPWSKYMIFTVWWSDLAEKDYKCYDVTGGNTLTNVMPTTSPLLGGDLLKASIDTISASTAIRKKTWLSNESFTKQDIKRGWGFHFNIILNLQVQTEPQLSRYVWIFSEGNTSQMGFTFFLTITYIYTNNRLIYSI